ncbi:hypothetical protein [Sunxiuqinia indica]|uniref:hypothetical protein n=1 Tax=Sunxiuqinia indica TaxID=2692584 RepID=UPI001358636F|nr:hypothetical protein [Sunxiuqinia indica]
MSDSERDYLLALIEEQMESHMTSIKKNVHRTMIVAISTMLTMLGLTIALAGPATATAYNAKQGAAENKKDILQLKEELDNKIDERYVLENFISRGNYVYLDNIEHSADVEAIRNPNNSDVIYFKFNNGLKELLRVDNFRGTNEKHD